MEEAHLVKRHGGASAHAHAANMFFFEVLMVLNLYPLLLLITLIFRLNSDRVLRWVRWPATLVVVWAVLLAINMFHGLHPEMLEVSRRSGQLAIASATITVALSFKPCMTLFMNAAPLVPLHKWAGRTSIALALVHGALYSIAFIQQHGEKHGAEHGEEHGDAAAAAARLVRRHAGHEHKPFSTPNILGMISLAAFVVILLSSLKPVRRRSYALFYALHRPLALLVYILMIWHARPSAWLLVPVGLVMLGLQLVVRALLTSRLRVLSTEVFGRDLLLVTFATNSGLTDLNAAPMPGAYIRVSPPIFSPTQFFRPSHPYTMAGPGLLVARQTRFELRSDREYAAWGPFPSALDVRRWRHVLVLAGGSGISMVPGILAQVAANASAKGSAAGSAAGGEAGSEASGEAGGEQEAKHPGQSVHVVWATGHSGEAAVLPRLGVQQCSVFVTRDAAGAPLGTKTGDAEEYDLDALDTGADFAVDSDDEASSRLMHPAGRVERGIVMRAGRPDFDEVAQGFVAAEAERRVDMLVIACGPESLVADAERWAAKRGYTCWAEAYAL